MKAEVRAELDFSESEATSETYKPNAASEAQAIRSQQSVEDSNSGAGSAQGVPGALTNQPPGPASAPFNAPAGANAGANAGAGQGAGGASSRKENTVNFEVDKTIRHVKEPLGRVKRLSVAVVVNYRAAVEDQAGQAGKPTPLTPQELTQINNLVKEAMGYSQERGDTINVVNAAFSEVKTEVDIPIWKDPDTVSMTKSLLKNLIMFGLAFYLVFGVLRPLLRDLVKPPEGGEAGGMLHGARGAGAIGVAIPGEVKGEGYADSLTRVKEFAKANPKVTADVIKEWMSKE